MGQMAGIGRTRAFRWAPLAAALVLAILLSGVSSWQGAPPAAAQNGCPALPLGLSPEGGPAPSRFTMLIRINQIENVNTYVNKTEATGGLGGRIRPQDIFVINTRFEKSTPANWYQMADMLRAAFPCNRIIALNGMSLDPTVPGYAFALIDHPATWALMTDFEQGDWNSTRGTDPGRPPWDHRFKKAFPRIKQWDARLSKTLAANPVGAAKRSGLVPWDGGSSWNFRMVAQDLDKKNRRLGGTKLGPLSVQTQDACADGGASGLRDRAAALFDQYKYKVIKKVRVIKKDGKKFKKKRKIRRKIKPKGRPLRSNLSLQISFSDTPNPNAGMAITKTAPSTAAACARAALKRGGGAFFFFASDDSMRLLFQQPQISSLRPPTT